MIIRWGSRSLLVSSIARAIYLGCLLLSERKEQGKKYISMALDQIINQNNQARSQSTQDTTKNTLITEHFKGLLGVPSSPLPMIYNREIRPSLVKLFTGTKLNQFSL